MGRASWLVVAMVCAGCGSRSALDGAPPARAIDPDAYEVAFVRTHSGTRNGDILLWHSTTQAVTKLASLPPLGYGGAPELTYDGRFLAANIFRGDFIELRVLNANGSVARSQPLSKNTQWLPWTIRPDGQRVLLQGESQVEALDADGAVGTVLATTPQDFLVGGSYSPDGTTIICARIAGAPSDPREEIDLVRDDGSSRVVIVPPDAAEVELMDPSFSFDGGSIVYARRDSHEDVTIVLLDLASHAMKTFDLGGSGEDPSPRLTPDGKSIVFIAWVSHEYYFTQELRRLEVATGAVETLYAEKVWGEATVVGISIAREP